METIFSLIVFENDRVSRMEKESKLFGESFHLFEKEFPAQKEQPVSRTIQTYFRRSYFIDVISPLDSTGEEFSRVVQRV